MLQATQKKEVDKVQTKQTAFDWNIGVIDDDEAFLFLIQKQASRYNINVTCFESISAITYKKQIRTFDVILVDFQIEEFNGLQIAEYISSFFSGVPVILVSGSDDPPKLESWSPNIQTFLPKKLGVDGILKETLFWLNNRYVPISY